VPLFKKSRGSRAASAETKRPSRSASAATVPAAPPLDPLLGDAQAHRFRAELAEGRWQEFHDFLDSITGWDDRQTYIYRLSSLIDGRPDWLHEWVAAKPASSLPLLFRGTHGTSWAWRARGSGRANTVEQDAWQVFFARLVEADRDLAAASALDPADPTAHARSLWTAIGLQLGQHEIRRRFGEVVRRHLWHQDAHHSMIQALAAKWHGSNAEMFEFARSVSLRAPEGHGLHALIASAHLEQWLNLTHESTDGRERQIRYFCNPAVQVEIRAAAAKSIGSSRYARTLRTPDDRNGTCQPE
jgi:hypothetical protein